MAIALSKPHPRISAALTLILVCGFFCQALQVAATTSLTIDEGLHIASGYTIWRTGDYRLIEEHPPAIKLWMTLPLLPLSGLADPRTLPAWDGAAAPTTESLPLLQMAQQLLYPHQPVDRWLFPARAMSTLLGVLLMAVLSRWTRETIGVTGSLVALALATFDPNLLAHAAVAGTDLGATTFITLALWQGTRFLKAPDWHGAIASGAVLGLALAAKLTGLLLGAALALSGVLRLRTLPVSARRALLRQAASVLFTAVAVLWACYGLQVEALPGLPFPIPAAAHRIPIMRLLSHSQGGHQAFLLGRNSMRGWWYYFPVAFLIKTPLPALLGLAMAAGSTLASRRSPVGGQRPPRMPVSPASAFVLVYAGTSALSSLNIGYRHLLPLVPLMYLAVGSAFRDAAHSSQTSRPIVAVIFAACLLVGQAVGTIAQAPHLLAFFNQAIGGADEGWRYLADSNTDWGQAYKHLAAYQQATDSDSVKLSAFLFYDPAVYGVDYEPLPPLGGNTPAIFPSRFTPPAGAYAISATPLDGIPTADAAMYDWFRWRKPEAKIGDAIFYYEVTADETATSWLAQCTTPAAPLNSDAVVAGFGSVPPRQLTFDCRQTWVYPSAESGSGAYALHGELLDSTLQARLHLAAPPASDPFIDAHLKRAQVIYWQQDYRQIPAFALFRQSAPPTGAIGSPIPLDGPLTFLGAQNGRHGEEHAISTRWLVNAAPGDRAFSIMGHLTTEMGEQVGVADGLGVHPAALQPGDIVVQRHRFHRDSEVEATVFLTGAYWLDTLQRWSVAVTASEATPADVIRLPLAALP